MGSATLAWASSVLILSKHDGFFRMCIDYRKLKTVTLRDTYPFPRLDPCIDILGHAVVFPTMNALWRYWKMSVGEENKNKTTFTGHAETYRFNQMRFKLMNAPMTFQNSPESILNEYKFTFCLVYLVEIIFFLESNGQHLQDIEDVPATLCIAYVPLMLKKCHWFIAKVKYLERTITPHKPSKTESPKTGLKDMKHFHVLVELAHSKEYATSTDGLSITIPALQPSSFNSLTGESRQHYLHWMTSKRTVLKC